jgi:hypothetical protein
MLITVRKQDYCAIVVNRGAVRVMCIARQKRNVTGVGRKSYVPRVSIEKCLFIGRCQGQTVARWQVSEYKRSQRARYKVEALFAELKQQIKLRRVRLRRLWNVAEQFHLAATAQNLKRLVRYLAQKQLPELSST